MDTQDFKGNLPNFIFKKKLTKVKVESVFSVAKEQKGVPQGNFLSIVLFIIYINSLVDHIWIRPPSIQYSLLKILPFMNS